MGRSGRVRLLLVCATAAIVGCGGGRGMRGGRTQTVARPWPLPVLSPVEVPLAAESAPRGTFTVDAAKLPSWDEVERALGGLLAAPADGYVAVSADDCRRRAAETAPVVELLELERAMAEQVVRCGYDSGGRLAAQARLLGLRINDRRSRAAADALVRLHQLADADLQLRTSEAIARELDQMLEAADKIEQVTGNAVPERRDLAVRKAEARDQSAEFAVRLDTLDEQLRAALAMEAGDGRRIRPEVETAVAARPVDVDEAVAVALERRVELESLRLVDETLSADTLGTARSLLAQEDGGLGTVATPAEAVRSQVGKYEAGVRRMQLATARSGSESRIAAEVRAAAAETEIALRHVARAVEVRAHRFETSRLLELEARAGRATQFAVGAANIDALRSDAALGHEILQLRQAEIRLKAATGTLLD